MLYILRYLKTVRISFRELHYTIRRRRSNTMHTHVTKEMTSIVRQLGMVYTIYRVERTLRDGRLR
jgi:hypothetical protein